MSWGRQYTLAGRYHERSLGFRLIADILDVCPECLVWAGRYPLGGLDGLPTFAARRSNDPDAQKRHRLVT